MADEPHRFAPQQIGLGVAIGAGLGLVFDNFAVGAGVGVALGALRSRRG